MKKVKPYKSTTAALKAIDNGGRFYNLFTKANDGEVTEAELAKVAGVFSDHKLMHLFLEMSLIELPSAEKVISALSPSLKLNYENNKPILEPPIYTISNSQAGHTVILTGIPSLIESKTEFNGFIMIPMTTGNATTMMMMPMFDQYDVYELKDEKDGDKVILAHARGVKKLEEKRTRIGGCLKPRKETEESDNEILFVELCYYTPL